MTLRSVLTYAAILVGTLAGAEFLARVYAWSPSRDDAAGDRLGQWRYYHSSSGSGDLAPGQDGHWVIWFHRPYHVQTNSAGLRNAAEISDRTFRILAVGDSQTFGAFVANEDAWPGWAENFLNVQAKDPDHVQILNAGIAGYTISDELAYLKDKGVTLRPKLVLLSVIENDIIDLRKEVAGTPQRPKDGALSRLQITLRAIGRSSALVSLAGKVKTSIQFAGASIDIRRGEGDTSAPREAPIDMDALTQLYGHLFRETVALLKGQDIKLAVFYVPSAEAFAGGLPPTVEPVIRALAGETGTPYLDVTPILQRQQDPAERLYLLQKNPKTGVLTGNGHLSREGHAAVGRAVADWMMAANLVPAR